MSGAGRTGPTGRFPLRWVVRIGTTFVVLILLLWWLPADELWTAIRTVPPLTWPLAIGAYLCSHLLGVTKWRRLTNAAGAALSGRVAAQAYYWGLFGNLFLPSIVGGDVVRAGVALPRARSKSGLLLGSLIDRMQDVVGLGLLAGVGAVLSPRVLDSGSRRIFLVFVATLTAAGVAALAALRLFPVRRVPFRWRRRLVQVRRAIRATVARPDALATAFLLGLALQTALVALNWQLGRLMGIDVPFYVWLFVWPLAKIAGLTPLTQGGIGVREAAQAALFAPFGVPAVGAVAAGFVFEVVLFGGGLISGVVALVLRRPAAAAPPRDIASPEPGRPYSRQGGPAEAPVRQDPSA